MKHKPPKGYMTTTDAAAKVGCSAQAITRRVQKGKIKARRSKRPKGEKGFPWLLFVREKDVVEMAKEFKPRPDRATRKSQVRLKKTNSSKQIEHTGEVWQVFNGSDTPIFSGVIQQVPETQKREGSGCSGIPHHADGGRASRSGAWQCWCGTSMDRDRPICISDRGKQMKTEQVETQVQEKDASDQLQRLRETAVNFLNDSNAHSPNGSEPNSRDAFILELARDVVGVYGDPLPDGETA